MGASPPPANPKLTLFSSLSQWVDRGAVGAAREPGRGRDHDGGGRILHAVRCSLALPPEAGEQLGDEAKSVGQGGSSSSCPSGDSFALEDGIRALSGREL